MNPDAPRDPDVDDDNDSVLNDATEGDSERDGIPANGTRPVKPQGPEDLSDGAVPRTV